MKLRASQSPPADGPVWDLIRARTANVGGGSVDRTIPAAGRRTVGPWCFMDRYGPVDNVTTMQVDPHPHTGLQTVTWLLQGEMEHHDSLGTVQSIKPGQLNWMTAGRGIVHAEYARSGPIEGVQLWVALPEAARHIDPSFTHLAALPHLPQPQGNVVVLAGTIGSHTSGAPEHHPIVGAEIRGRAELPLDTMFEHAVAPLRGEATVDGRSVDPGSLVYLGRGRSSVTVEAEVALLLGGAPLGEPLLLWWNFAERTHDEVVASRGRWESDQMGTVAGTTHRIPAPPLGS